MKKLILVCGMLLSSPMMFACRPAEPSNFTMIAQIQSINEKIEVNILTSEFMSGHCLVITSDQTQFFNSTGNEISKSNLQIGNKIEITYSGQVMMSYPPQIVAYTIKVKN